MKVRGFANGPMGKFEQWVTRHAVAGRLMRPGEDPPSGVVFEHAEVQKNHHMWVWLFAHLTWEQLRILWKRCFEGLASRGWKHGCVGSHDGLVYAAKKSPDGSTFRLTIGATTNPTSSTAYNWVFPRIWVAGGG